MDSPDLAHGSELFVFFGFCFLEVLAKLQKTMEKPKKKSSDPCPLPGLSPDLAHGSELFVFFFSHCCFACFSCEDAFITVPLKKMRVSTICTPAHPRPNCKKKHGKTKIHLMTYIMTNIMINIMIHIMIHIMINIMMHLMTYIMTNIMNNVMITVMTAWKKVHSHSGQLSISKMRTYTYIARLGKRAVSNRNHKGNWLTTRILAINILFEIRYGYLEYSIYMFLFIHRCICIYIYVCVCMYKL